MLAAAGGSLSKSGGKCDLPISRCRYHVIHPPALPGCISDRCHPCQGVGSVHMRSRPDTHRYLRQFINRSFFVHFQGIFLIGITLTRPSPPTARGSASPASGLPVGLPAPPPPPGQSVPCGAGAAPRFTISTNSFRRSAPADSTLFPHRPRTCATRFRIASLACTASVSTAVIGTSCFLPVLGSVITWYDVTITLPVPPPGTASRNRSEPQIKVSHHVSNAFLNRSNARSSAPLAVRCDQFVHACHELWLRADPAVEITVIEAQIRAGHPDPGRAVPGVVRLVGGVAAQVAAPPS